MPIYLAYQTEPEQWTKDKLARIIDDYFDLQYISFNCAEEVLEYADRMTETMKNAPSGRKLLGEYISEDCLLLRVQNFLDVCTVKNHPLLEITFRYKDKGSKCPDNFTGLNITPEHSGSAGIVDLIEFKPTMDDYMRKLGIDYIDRSKTKLAR
jgi:hypothetical protein